LSYAFAEANSLQPEVQTQFVTAGSLLYSVEHRPWLPPDAQWLLSQTWNDLLFAHFAISPPVLRSLVPDALTLDLYDGVAWLTVSAFCINHLRPSGIPPLPGLSHFPQLILRTYVTMAGKSGEAKPGLFYFSVDSANLSAVWCARIFFRMQYWHSSIQIGAAQIGAAQFDGTTTHARPARERIIHFRSSRLHGPAAFNGSANLEVAYAPEGEAERPRRGSLNEFLTERYCVYSWNRRKYYRTEVHHQPWPLQSATIEIRANSMAEPLGIALPAEPDLCHFSRSLKMLTWAPEFIGRSR
jgi:uncharacterized protein YqjF (DUF2071 family)